jgi:hypothetical protein
VPRVWHALRLVAGDALDVGSLFRGPHEEGPYVEPTAVGRELLEMPLFLEPEIYVNVPLEATYQAAHRGVPRRWKAVLESAGS